MYVGEVCAICVQPKHSASGRGAAARSRSVKRAARQDQCSYGILSVDVGKGAAGRGEAMQNREVCALSAEGEHRPIARSAAQICRAVEGIVRYDQSGNMVSWVAEAIQIFKACAVRVHLEDSAIARSTAPPTRVCAR